MAKGNVGLRQSLVIFQFMISAALITGTLITGDDFSGEGQWKPVAKEWLQDPQLLKLSASGVTFRPVEGNSSDKAG